MISCILVDDEISAIETFTSIVKSFSIELNVMAYGHTIDEGVSLIKKHQPELVFLDIQLKDGLGMDILKFFANRNFQVVFVTAYNQYGIEALKLKAFDYLLKPVNPLELQELVEKLKQQELSTFKKEEPQKIAIPQTNGTRIVSVDEIIRIESENNYSKVYVEGEKPIIVAKTLKKFEEALQGSSIIRIHQSHLVNTKFIKELRKDQGGYVVLNNGHEIAVSNSKKAILEEAVQIGVIAL